MRVEGESHIVGVTATEREDDAEEDEVTEEAVSGNNALDEAVSADEAPVPAESEDTEV